MKGQKMKHFEKGSPEAYRWAARMKKARKIRRAGIKTEREFFGKGGPLEVKNPSFASDELKRYVEEVHGIPWIKYIQLSTKKKDNIIHFYNLYRNEVKGNPEPFTLLSHGIYAVTDRMAGELARQSKAGRLPQVGREIRVILPSGKQAWLTRTNLTMLDRVKNKRGWVWSVHHFSESDGAAIPFGKSYGPNPITVVGLANPQENPPRSVNANIEGIIYNRCIEIRAEKTGYKRGFYKHPFSRGSQVCIYALDNGDLLVHSKAGVKLWQPD